jgi:branched-chain amino acid transport system ATP-binding protein
MLSIAREMMTAPQLMLVDEPTAGLSPALVSQVYELLHATRRAGSTVLLVDQNIEDAVREADHVYLVDLGRVYAQGPAREFPLARLNTLIQECLLQ